MNKRTVSIIMVLILVICILPLNAAAGTLSNFTKARTYTAGQFSDVSNQWFAADVKTAYEFNLVQGTSASTFSPYSNLTLSEAITLASTMHSIYNTGSSTFAKGITPWYQPYVDYALTNGIIQSPYPNYMANATRSDMAVIFANVLPDEALTPLNKIDDNTIPDVSVSYTYGAAVYKLYRAGVLTGSGDNHAYSPNNSITRSEIAAIVARMASSSNRVAFKIASKELASTEVAAKCSPAVFYIELYDSTGAAFASGSGFFISSSGLAVTNFHVIDGAVSAKIMTVDKKTYDVTGVYDYSEEYDLALLQINGTHFPFLDVGDSSTALTGATVYAIGSPKGLDNTFTQGIISNASRKFSDSVVNFIQIDAAISHGSSGGALLNTRGQVIGVTAAGSDDGQNINFAVPINLIKELSTATSAPLSSVVSQKVNLAVTASPSTVSVAKGAQASVNFTVNSYDFYDSYYTVANESVISCTWGQWDNYSIPLTITGLSAGTTTVLLELVDKDNKTITSMTVYVTVTGSGSTSTYYAGYYPVPDWGVFTGTPLYNYFTYTDGGASFYYRMSDITAPSTLGVGGYVDLLKSNGFYYSTSFDNSQGYPVNVYENQTFLVYMAVTTLGGVLCMQIMILPA